MSENYETNYPCDDCGSKDDCDHWETVFCCTLCNYNYDGDPPCENCDPMDI